MTTIELNQTKNLRNQKNVQEQFTVVNKKKFHVLAKEQFYLAGVTLMDTGVWECGHHGRVGESSLPFLGLDTHN